MSVYPGGREGIQADLATFAAHGSHGTSVLTAVTAQSPTGSSVRRVIIPPDFVEQQITSTLRTIRVHAVKTGALFSSEIARTVASTLGTYFRHHGRVPLVCDSVHVSDYGPVLSGEDVRIITNELFPLAQVITLSEAEAQYVLNMEGRPLKMASLHDMLVAAQHLLAFQPRAVLLKGGRTLVSLNDILAAQAPADASLDIKTDFPLGENIEILGIKNSPETKDHAVDVLCRASSTGSSALSFTLYPRPSLGSENVRGADAAFSAALACALGNDTPVEEAVAQAATFTRLAVETASSPGKGNGPLGLNYLHSTSRLIVHPATSRYPYPLTFKFIQNTAALWKQYVRHDFVVQLGKGTLDDESFKHFIQQDYLYLKYYARAYALLASKSNDFASINFAAKAALDISEEASRYGATSSTGVYIVSYPTLDLSSRSLIEKQGEPLRLLMSGKSSIHGSFLSRWGTSLRDLERTPESPATTAYGAFLMDTGLQGDTTALVMAVAACLLGYGEVGLWLKSEAQKPDSWVKWEGNPYLEWMEGYAGEVYQAGVVAGLEWMELLAKNDLPSQSRYDLWFSVWERTVGFEKAFWDMALNLS